MMKMKKNQTEHEVVVEVEVPEENDASTRRQSGSSKLLMLKRVVCSSFVISLLFFGGNVRFRQSFPQLRGDFEGEVNHQNSISDGDFTPLKTKNLEYFQHAESRRRLATNCVAPCVLGTSYLDAYCGKLDGTTQCQAYSVPPCLTNSDCVAGFNCDLFSVGQGIFILSCSQHNAAAEYCLFPNKFDSNNANKCTSPKKKIDNCFSAETEVLGLKGMMKMSALSIGDYVWTGERYSRIYAFAHKNTKRLANFVSIQTNASDLPLEISEEHLLFIKGNKYPVPAAKIRVGDELFSHISNTDIAVVRAVASILRNGVYSPLTTDGILVVNGVVASNYVTTTSDEQIILGGKIRLPISVHYISHIWMSPVRIWCTLKTCTNDINDEDGTNYWATIGLVSQHNPYLQLFLLIAFGLPLAVLALVEMCIILMVSHHTVFAYGIGSVIVLVFFLKYNNDRTKKTN